MADQNSELAKALGYYGQIGITFAAAIFIGLGMGVYADKKFGTEPWLTFLGLAFGIAAGFKTLFEVLIKSKKGEKTPSDGSN